MDESLIKTIESIIGYSFSNKELLVRALTHSSYVNEHAGSESYERLEFLGDSILNFIVAEQLYYASVKDEGEMTVKRSRLVSRRPLYEVVCKLGLYEFVRFGHGAENNEFFSEKTRSDIFESILAAIYIDSGSLSEPKKFVESNINYKIAFSGFDYKSRLQEYAQAHKVTLTYPVTQQIGVPSHPFFKAEALLDGKTVGVGTGTSKKEAQQNAAKEIYEELGLNK